MASSDRCLQPYHSEYSGYQMYQKKEEGGEKENRNGNNRDKSETP